MIEISHPRILGKPPVKKRLSIKSTSNLLPRDREEVAEPRAGKCLLPDEWEIEDRGRTIVDGGDLLNDIVEDLRRTGALESDTDVPQLEPERDPSTKGKGAPAVPLSGPSYDDIVAFLERLEDGIDESRTTGATFHPAEADLDSWPLHLADLPSPPSRENLGDKCRKEGAKVTEGAPLELAEDMTRMKFQIEEKDAAIELLREQLKKEKRSSREKEDALGRSEASKLRSQEDRYRGIVRRHQSFIERLIAEKTQLAEKCTSLAERVKEAEARARREAKAAAERHAVELQRLKDHCAAAEKIKRERWIEARTLKIKEMTVKGLEPELREMVARHEEEMQKSRNDHAREIEETILRAARESNQRLEELRLELTAAHEKALVEERNILWNRYKQSLEEQENLFQERRDKLLEQALRERNHFENELSKLEEEKRTRLERAEQRHREETEELKNRHVSEKRSLREELMARTEATLAEREKRWIIEQRRTESKIREECSRERDRQIEIAIGRLEKDSRDAEERLRKSFDEQSRSTMEKYETDLRAAIDDATSQRDKLSRCKDSLDKTETRLRDAEEKLRDFANDSRRAKETIDRLSVERDDARIFARQEIESEKQQLEERIASLYREIARNNAERDASMTRLHSRIKLVVTRKILTIRNLAKQLEEAKSKCDHFEKLIHHQRREYHLKSF